nr:vesicle-fusing ATPase [Ipomoea batatas]GMD43711.1 vesicle-fusing ATPase [Ipomoea batatas]
MAGWSSSTMIVTNTPAKDLAYTNFAYCSPADLRNFVVPGSKLAYALVADAYVLSICHLNYEILPMTLFPMANLVLMQFNAEMQRFLLGTPYLFIPPEDFNLALLTLELEFVRKGTKDEQVDAVQMSNQIRKRFGNQVMTAGQRVTFEYHGNGYIFTVTQAQVEGYSKSNKIERGLLSSDTYIIFEASNASGIKITNQREAASSNIFRQKEFNLESLGIGGLSAEFADIFRRAFASRVFPPHVTSKYAIYPAK